MKTRVRDGVRLAYLERGASEPTLLLVHGWCCDHSHLARQADYFQSGHHVISVDLRGHGVSDAPEQSYSMAGFADDLAWLIDQLHLERVVVIGHSMGGTVAIELAARHPERVAAIVAIDSSLLPGAVARQYMLEHVVPGLHGPNYQSVMRDLVERTMFLPSDDAELKQRISRQMEAAPQRVMATAAADMFTRDAPTVAAACRAPLLFINSGTPRSDLELLRELCPQLVVGTTVGAGHFSQLVVPEQVNAMIARFLALALESPTAPC